MKRRDFLSLLFAAPVAAALPPPVAVAKAIPPATFAVAWRKNGKTELMARLSLMDCSDQNGTMAEWLREVSVQ